MSFRFVQANVQQPDSSGLRLKTIKTVAGAADVATFNEAKNDHAALKALSDFSEVIGKSGENIIIWRTALFDLLDQDTAIVMTGGVQNGKRRGPSRDCTIAVLNEKSTGKPVIVVSHHAIARPDTSHPERKPLQAEGFKNSAALVKKMQAKFPGAPVIFAGDLNATGKVTLGFGETEVKTPATFPANKPKLRYDRILTSGFAPVSSVAVLHTESDHLALTARVALVKPAPAPAPSRADTAIANAQRQSAHGPKFGEGECKMRCRLLFGVPSDGTPDATADWKGADFRHRITNTGGIPRGALIWWTGGSKGHGHVAVSNGDGRCWSTDIKRTGFFDLVPIELISQTWKTLTLAGWTEDIDGVRVITVTDIPARPELPVFKPQVDGVDLSHFQTKPINWAAAKAAGVRFAYHKATEGRTIQDALYDRRRRECLAAKIPFGAYHFAHPASSSGTDQAKKFLAKAKPQKGDLRPMLDLEKSEGLSDEKLTVWVKQFVTEVKRQTGKPPVLYTNQNILRDPGCFLWVARYNNTNTLPKIPASAWKQWSIWQFSNGELGRPNRVPGIAEPCDLNTLRTGFDLDRLKL